MPERIVRSTLGFSAGVCVKWERWRFRSTYAAVSSIETLSTPRCGFYRTGRRRRGTYPQADAIAERFLARRTAGNAIEALGIIAFRASPVWVLALADVCGIGRRVIPEIAAALKQEGLLDADVEVATVDQLLDGLERTSARLAATVNTLRSISRRFEQSGRRFDKTRRGFQQPTYHHEKRSLRCGIG